MKWQRYNFLQTETAERYKSFRRLALNHIFDGILCRQARPVIKQENGFAGVNLAKRVNLVGLALEAGARHEPVFTRPVISREKAEELINSIPDIEEDHFVCHSVRMANEHYQAALQSHDCEELVQLIKTVYAKSRRHGRRVSQVDQRYRKRAEELLNSELSVALGIPLKEVPAYINQRIGKLGKKTAKKTAE